MSRWIIALCVIALVPGVLPGASIAIQTGTPGWEINGNPAFVTDGSGFPFGPWAPAQNGTPPEWISPRPGYVGSLSDAPGTYLFTYDFNVPITAVPGSGTLTGVVGYDNLLTDILLNGTSLGFAGPTNQFSAALPVNLIGLTLLSGDNQIMFRVENLAGVTGNPTGLFADLTLSYSQVPEPSTWMMIAGGLGLAIAARWRRVNG
jgi:hypothetical protein